MKFTTINGSVYKLDKQAMTWERIGTTSKSGKIRQENGKLLSWPRIDIGWGALLNDSKVRPGMQVHYISTSKVVSVEDE